MWSTNTSGPSQTQPRTGSGVLQIGEVCRGEAFERHAVWDAFDDAPAQPLIEGLLLRGPVERGPGGELRPLVPCRAAPSTRARSRCPTPIPQACRYPPVRIAPRTATSRNQKLGSNGTMHYSPALDEPFSPACARNREPVWRHCPTSECCAAEERCARPMSFALIVGMQYCRRPVRLACPRHGCAGHHIRVALL